MDEQYDAIVLGTGLTECIISGLLSVDGYKVLHMDRNNYYGGESASLNLNQLWERFRPGQKPSESLGPSRDFNVDMVPKFIMANGNLVKVLVKTDVTKYLEFKAVDGSFVLNREKVEKVPATSFEALKSPLMGFFEKRRAAKFLSYCQDYDAANPATHQGRDLTRMPMAELFKAFGLDDMTIEFVGHSLALHSTDEYLRQPAQPTVEKIKLYHESLMRFYDQGIRSPYIYPLYGLGELPQAFARLSAVYGGTYMLSKPDVEVVYDAEGVATGVKSEGETARAKFVVGDPSYFKDRVMKVGKVVRAIAILSHPIPGTDNAQSAQIILPQKQIGRKNDMYVFCCSYSHNVCARDKWIAFVSTTVETTNPEAELAAGLALLGPTDEKFTEVTDVYAPISDGTEDKAFISRSADATSHFETLMTDVLSVYQRITGKPLDLQNYDATRATEEQ
jgi:Rab GDP dissociation inhibitor